MRLPERAGAVGALAMGVALLARPDETLRLAGVDPALPHLRAATRVLGARHLVQGVGLLLLPREVPTAAAVVDAVHAASMLVVAARAPRYRRAALVSALGAVLTGTLTAATGRRR